MAGLKHYGHSWKGKSETSGWERRIGVSSMKSVKQWNLGTLRAVQAVFLVRKFHHNSNPEHFHISLSTWKARKLQVKFPRLLGGKADPSTAAAERQNMNLEYHAKMESAQRSAQKETHTYVVS